MHDDNHVTLTGNISGRADHVHYWLRDSTGRIRVDRDDDEKFTGKNLITQEKLIMMIVRIRPMSTMLIFLIDLTVMQSQLDAGFNSRKNRLMKYSNKDRIRISDRPQIH